MLLSFILLSCLLTATFQDEIDTNAETVAKQADVPKNDEEPVASNVESVGGSSGDKTNEARLIQEATEMLEKQNEMAKPAEATASKESSAVDDAPIQPFDEPSVVETNSEPKAEAVKEAPKEVRFSLSFNHIKLKYRYNFTFFFQLKVEDAEKPAEAVESGSGDVQESQVDTAKSESENESKQPSNVESVDAPAPAESNIKGEDVVYPDEDVKLPAQVRGNDESAASSGETDLKSPVAVDETKSGDGELVLKPEPVKGEVSVSSGTNVPKKEPVDESGPKVELGDTSAVSQRKSGRVNEYYIITTSIVGGFVLIMIVCFILYRKTNIFGNRPYDPVAQEPRPAIYRQDQPAQVV